MTSGARTMFDTLICATISISLSNERVEHELMQSDGQSGLPAPNRAPIVVEGLSKTYQVPEREGGFGHAVRSFFRRSYRAVNAVQQVSFRIDRGEIVGFLGPNGAGKTTTLKM